MNIIKCVIRGQALTVLTPLMADLTVNYFNVEADFSREWDNGPYGVLTKHVHIHRKDDHTIGSDWSLDFDNKLASTNGINLSAGTWEIWFSSAIVDGSTGETLWRLTTEVKTFEVAETGTGGGYMPDIPQSNVDQITAIAQEALDIAQSVRDDADAGEFDGPPGQPGPQGPPGNYTKPATGIPKNDLSESVQISLGKADTALQASGDGSNVTVAFTTAGTRANIVTGEKLSVIFGKIAKWFADLGTAAFRAATSSISSGSNALVESGAVHTALATKYEKPSGGIPKADLASAVQTSLGKADTALQSVPSTYRTATAQDAIDSAQNANIGIVQNTDKATQSIKKGQYVIWKGALYTASAEIISGATLSSSNLTAVQNGGLNDLTKNFGAKSIPELGLTTPTTIRNIVSALPYGGSFVISITAGQVSDANFTGELYIRTASNANVKHKTDLYLRTNTAGGTSIGTSFLIGLLPGSGNAKWYVPTLTERE